MGNTNLGLLIDFGSHFLQKSSTTLLSHNGQQTHPRENLKTFANEPSPVFGLLQIPVAAKSRGCRIRGGSRWSKASHWSQFV